MKIAIVFLLAFGVAACTDSEWANLSSYGEPHIVELYSGAQMMASWESTGKVECTDGGICQFMDAKTGKFVRTTGDVVVRVK